MINYYDYLRATNKPDSNESYIDWLCDCKGYTEKEAIILANNQQSI